LSVPRKPLSRVLVVVAALAPAPASANPRPLPFTYTYETLPEGSVELEQFADLTPLRALSATSGAPTWYLGTQLQTELEYGITDRLELGLYFTLVPETGESLTGRATMLEGNGVKQRLRLRLAEEGEWPLDVALYGEVVENDREIELEAKIILQKRIERLRLTANIWAEREFYYVPQRDWVLNPTAGATFQISPRFHPGVEGWMRLELPDPAPSPKPFNLRPHVYVGPTMMFNFGRLWWSTGIYLRLDDGLRSMQPGDTYGNLWVRTMVGVGF
jgi:hypothetical protein